MSDSLKLEMHTMDNAECAEFTPTNHETWYALVNAFDGVLDGLGSRQMSFQAGIKRLKEMVKSEPCFLDAYAHLGLYLSESNLTQSDKWYLEGVEKGKSLIPEGFSATIPWGFLDNRPFLRCHHGYILSLLRKSKYDLAIAEMELHLQWNPNDNIGVRYLLGDACMLAKQYDKALKAYAESMDEYPACCYGLGLIHFMQKDFCKAITCFRKGFLSNLYIAELLTGKTELVTKRYWHGTSTASPRGAIEYMDSTGRKIWKDQENAVLFVDWLLNCSLVLAERAQDVQQREAFQCEQDANKRVALLKKRDVLWDTVTDETSKKLAQKITTHDDGECWPWEATGWRDIGF